MKLRTASQQKQQHPLREGMSWKDKMRAELMKLINQHLNQQKSQDFVSTAKTQDTIGELARSYKTSYLFWNQTLTRGLPGSRSETGYTATFVYLLTISIPQPLSTSYPFSWQTQIQFMNILANIHDRVHWPWLISNRFQSHLLPACILFVDKLCTQNFITNVAKSFLKFIMSCQSDHR